jgi:hypothetical protein
VRVKTSTSISMYSTFNILAETVGGIAGDTIVVGAHLDSVTAGPGSSFFEVIFLIGSRN